MRFCFSRADPDATAGCAVGWAAGWGTALGAAAADPIGAGGFSSTTVGTSVGLASDFGFGTSFKTFKSVMIVTCNANGSLRCFASRDHTQTNSLRCGVINHC